MGRDLRRLLNFAENVVSLTLVNQPARSEELEQLEVGDSVKIRKTGVCGIIEQVDGDKVPYTVSVEGVTLDRYFARHQLEHSRARSAPPLGRSDTSANHSF